MLDVIKARTLEIVGAGAAEAVKTSFVDPFFCTATNWFVDEKVSTVCPGELYFEVCQMYSKFLEESSINLLEKLLETNTVNKIVSRSDFGLIKVSLTIAYTMAVITKKGYIGIPFNIDMVGGRLRNMIDAYLSVPPDQSSVENLLALVNRLLLAFYPFEVQVKLGKRLVYDKVKRARISYDAIKIEAPEFPEFN